ncbi:MAG TPA: methionine--tRNA ligase, partial [Candidatus Woesearchaeota archaeon]|nr:methionine--tRNA ligase [Candidatus Woesearchaeota archaeon]
MTSSLLSGDVFSRFYKIRGFDTCYVSGTDMHGTRAEFEALKRGLNVSDLLATNHKLLSKLIKDFDISFDNYTHTETKVHKEFVKEIFKKIEKNGYISIKIEKRAYCKNCEIFLADAFIKGICPNCGYE